MFNPKELNRVQTANTRSSGVDYDLAYSEKTSKFRVSPEMYDDMDMTNHGLTLLEDSKNNALFLAAEPNEMAVMHRGREGFTKGREFTASRLRVKLDEYGFKGVNEFDLKHVSTTDGIRYYQITSEQQGETRKADDPTPVDHVPVDDTPEQPNDEPENQVQELPDYGDVGAVEPEPETEEPQKDQGLDHDDLDSLLG